MPDASTSSNEAGRPSAKPRYAPAELSTRLDQAWRVLSVNQEMIRSADQKIYLLIAISAVLASFVANNLEKILKMGPLQTVLLALFLVSSAGFLFFALGTLINRTQKSDGIAAENPRLIFFGDIARSASAGAYANHFRDADLHDVLDDLCHQIHSVARIATKKYRTYRLAWFVLMAEVALFLALEISVSFNIV
jgi:Family of unknown function (DUF5706)